MTFFFAVSVHFPLCFKKIILSPYFYKFPLCFTQIHLLFTYFTCIFPPYFYHDAFMHHPMHVLDAPGVLPLGTVSHLKSALFHGICPTRFTSSLKCLLSPGPGLRAPLSSYLEVALYKLHRQIDRHRPRPI